MKRNAIRKTLLLILIYMVGSILGLVYRGRVSTFLIILYHLSFLLYIIFSYRKLNIVFHLICSFLIIFGFTFSTFLVVMRIEGSSMEPVIKNNSLLMVWQQNFEVNRNDVLLFHHQDERIDELLFKEVVALPGDSISFIGPRLIINGNRKYTIKEYFPVEEMLDEHNRLKDGYYFVVGYAFNSYDSRYFGFISKNDILGKVLFIF